MTLKDLVREDALGTLLNEDDFAEGITYYPGGHLCDPRQISALVNREPPAADGPDEAGSPRNEITVRVGNDPTVNKGIAEVLEQVDLIDCPAKRGSTTTVRWRVLELLQQGDGMWTLRCGR